MGRPRPSSRSAKFVVLGRPPTDLANMLFEIQLAAREQWRELDRQDRRIVRVEQRLQSGPQPSQLPDRTRRELATLGQPVMSAAQEQARSDAHAVKVVLADVVEQVVAQSRPQRRVSTAWASRPIIKPSVSKLPSKAVPTVDESGKQLTQKQRRKIERDARRGNDKQRLERQERKAAQQAKEQQELSELDEVACELIHQPPHLKVSREDQLLDEQLLMGAGRNLVLQVAKVKVKMRKEGWEAPTAEDVAAAWWTPNHGLLCLGGCGDLLCVRRNDVKAAGLPTSGLRPDTLLPRSDLGQVRMQPMERGHGLSQADVNYNAIGDVLENEIPVCTTDNGEAWTGHQFEFAAKWPQRELQRRGRKRAQGEQMPGIAKTKHFKMARHLNKLWMLRTFKSRKGRLLRDKAGRVIPLPSPK